MKKWLFGNLLKALLVILIVTLLVGGAVYAYQTLWSSKARITIEPPKSAASMAISNVSVDKGTWDATTNTWTASMARGEWIHLTIYLKNTGGDICQIKGAVDGNDEGNRYIAPGVRIQWYGTGLTMPAGGEGYITFSLVAEETAQPGTLPEIIMELRE